MDVDEAVICITSNVQHVDDHELDNSTCDCTVLKGVMQNKMTTVVHNAMRKKLYDVKPDKSVLCN